MLIAVLGLASQTAVQKQKPHLRDLAARIRRRPNMWPSQIQIPHLLYWLG